MKKSDLAHSRHFFIILTIFYVISLIFYTKSLTDVIILSIATLTILIIYLKVEYFPRIKVKETILAKFSLEEDTCVEVLGFPNDTPENREKLIGAINSLNPLPNDIAFSTTIDEQAFSVSMEDVELSTQELSNMIRALGGKFFIRCSVNYSFAWFVENSEGEFLSETYSIAYSIDNLYEILNFEPME